MRGNDMITTNKTDLTIEKINGADTYKDDTRAGGAGDTHRQVLYRSHSIREFHSNTHTRTHIFVQIIDKRFPLISCCECFSGSLVLACPDKQTNFMNIARFSFQENAMNK